MNSVPLLRWHQADFTHTFLTLSFILPLSISKTKKTKLRAPVKIQLNMFLLFFPTKNRLFICKTLALKSSFTAESPHACVSVPGFFSNSFPSVYPVKKKKKSSNEIEILILLCFVSCFEAAFLFPPTTGSQHTVQPAAAEFWLQADHMAST